ncbi:hypothetical protein G6F59_017173 [Rhizopus arrhizus]|nr:hypothetical protein G6F59_017173 [Rhizopus arrhizus]
MPGCGACRVDDGRAAGDPLDGSSAGVGAGQPVAAGWLGAIVAGAGTQRGARAHAHGALSAGTVAAAARRRPACLVPGSGAVDRCHLGTHRAAAGAGHCALIGVLPARGAASERRAAVTGAGGGPPATGKCAAAD